MFKIIVTVLLSTMLNGCEAPVKEPSQETLEKIEIITNNESLSYEEKISELQRLASDLSYEHGIGNGEYHETYDTQAVHKAITELNTNK